MAASHNHRASLSGGVSPPQQPSPTASSSRRRSSAAAIEDFDPLALTVSSMATTMGSPAIPMPDASAVSRRVAFTELVAYTRQREEQLAKLNEQAHEDSFLLDSRSMLAGFTLEQIEHGLLPAWKAQEATAAFQRGLSLDAYLETVGAVARERYPSVSIHIINTMLKEVFTKMDASCSGFVNWNVFVMYLIDTADDVAMSSDALRKGSGSTAAGGAGSATGLAGGRNRSVSPGSDSDGDTTTTADASPTSGKKKKKSDANDFLNTFGIKSFGNIEMNDSDDDGCEDDDPKKKRHHHHQQHPDAATAAGGNADDNGGASATRNTLVLVPDDDHTTCINMCAGPLDFVGEMLCLEPLAYMALLTRMGILHIVEASTFRIISSVKYGGHCCAASFVHNRPLDQSVPGLFAVTSFIAVATRSFKLHIFPASQFKLRATINTPELINSLTFSYGDLYLYGGTRTGNVLCWIISPKGVPCLVRSISLHSDAINDMFFLSRGDLTLVTASSDTNVIEYSLSREQWVLDDAEKRVAGTAARKSGSAEVAILRNSSISQAAAAAEKVLAAASGTKKPSVVAAPTIADKGSEGGSGSTVAVASAKGQVPKMTTETSINITNSTLREAEFVTPTPIHIKKFKGHVHAVMSVVFAPPQKLLITTGADGSILCFVEGFPTVPAYHILDLANPHSGLIVHCSVDPSGLFLTTFDNSNLGKVWDLRTMRVTDSKTVVPHSRSKTIHATCSTHQQSSNTVFVNTNSHCHIFRLENPKDAVAGCIFEDSFDSLILLAPHPIVPSSIVAINLSTVVVWDVVQLKRLAVHENIWGTISAAAVDKSGNSFVAGSTFGELGVFRLDTGRLIRQYQMPANCGEVSVVQYAVSAGQIIAITDRRYVVFCPDRGENEFGCVQVTRVVPSVIKISRLVACPEAGVYIACDHRQECRSLMYNTVECVLRIRNVKRREDFLLKKSDLKSDLTDKQQERVGDAQRTTNETEKATRLQEKLAFKKHQRQQQRGGATTAAELNIKIPPISDLPRTLLDDEAECVNLCSLAPYPACIVSSTDGFLQLVCLKPHILADEVICRWENKADLVNMGASQPAKHASKLAEEKKKQQQEQETEPQEEQQQQQQKPKRRRRSSSTASLRRRRSVSAILRGMQEDAAAAAAEKSDAELSLSMSMQETPPALNIVPADGGVDGQRGRRRKRSQSITYIASPDGDVVAEQSGGGGLLLSNSASSRSLTPGVKSLGAGFTFGGGGATPGAAALSSGRSPRPSLFDDIPPVLEQTVRSRSRRNSLASSVGSNDDDDDESEKSSTSLSGSRGGRAVRRRSQQQQQQHLLSPGGTTKDGSRQGRSSSARTTPSGRTPLTPQLLSGQPTPSAPAPTLRNPNEDDDEDDDDRLPPVVHHMHWLHPYTLICIDDRQRIVVYDLSDVVLQSRLFDATTKMAPSMGNNVLVTSGSGAASPAPASSLPSASSAPAGSGGASSTAKQAILYFHKVLRPPIVRVVAQFHTPSQVNAMAFVRPCYLACLDDKSRPSYFAMIGNEITQVSAIPKTVARSRMLQTAFDEIRREKFSAPSSANAITASPSSPRSPLRSRSASPESPLRGGGAGAGFGSFSPASSMRSRSRGARSKYLHLWKKYTNLFRVIWLLTKFLGVSKIRQQAEEDEEHQQLNLSSSPGGGAAGGIGGVLAKRKKVLATGPTSNNSAAAANGAPHQQQAFPFITDRACLVGLAAGDDAPNFMCLSFAWCHDLSNIAMEGEDEGGDGDEDGEGSVGLSATASFRFSHLNKTAAERRRAGQTAQGGANGGINFHCRHNVASGRAGTSINYTHQTTAKAETTMMEESAKCASTTERSGAIMASVTPSVNLDRTTAQYEALGVAKAVALQRHQEAKANARRKHEEEKRSRQKIIAARRLMDSAEVVDEDEFDLDAAGSGRQRRGTTTNSGATTTKKKKCLNPQARIAAEEADRRGNTKMKHSLLLSRHNPVNDVAETRVVDRSPSPIGSSNGGGSVNNSRAASPVAGDPAPTSPPPPPHRLETHGEELTAMREGHFWLKTATATSPRTNANGVSAADANNKGTNNKEELSLLALLDASSTTDGGGGGGGGGGAKKKGHFGGSPPPTDAGAADDDAIDMRFFFEDRDANFQAKKKRVAGDALATVAKSKHGAKVPAVELMKRFGAGGYTMEKTKVMISSGVDDGDGIEDTSTAHCSVAQSPEGSRMKHRRQQPPPSSIRGAHDHTIRASSLAAMEPIGVQSTLLLNNSSASDQQTANTNRRLFDHRPSSAASTRRLQPAAAAAKKPTTTTERVSVRPSTATTTTSSAASPISRLQAALEESSIIQRHSSGEGGGGDEDGVVVDTEYFSFLRETTKHHPSSSPASKSSMQTPPPARTTPPPLPTPSSAATASSSRKMIVRKAIAETNRSRSTTKIAGQFASPTMKK